MIATHDEWGVHGRPCPVQKTTARHQSLLIGATHRWNGGAEFLILVSAAAAPGTAPKAHVPASHAPAGEKQDKAITTTASAM